MWPFWKLEEDQDCGVYELVMFCGVTLEKGGKETPCAVLKSLRGHLSKAIPIAALYDNTMAWTVEVEEAKLDNPERVAFVISEYAERDRLKEEECEETKETV
jgi:hypothetical protein